MSGLHTCTVRTTHGKTRLRAKRSFGPVAVVVQLNDAELALVKADPFLEVSIVEGEPKAPVSVLAVVEQTLVELGTVKPDAPKATKKAKG